MVFFLAKSAKMMYVVERLTQLSGAFSRPKGARRVSAANKERKDASLCERTLLLVFFLAP